MDVSELLISSMGMQDVTIEKFNFNKECRSINFWIRQKRADARCYHCLDKLYGIHQWRQRKLKGPSLGAFKEVNIYFFQFQGVCDTCQRMRLSYAPYIHPKFKNLTTAFSETAGRLMEEITCEATSRLMGHNSKQLWKLDQWRMIKMKESRAYLDLIKNADVSLLSADEVHMRTIKPKKEKWNKQEWERRFITNLVCYNHSKVIANAVGRDTRALKKCLLFLSEPQRLAVEYLSVDMHDPFIRAATLLCPNASIAVDRFHLAEQLNKRFDEIRKLEFEKARKEGDKFQEKILSGSRRFILVEREKDLSKDDMKQLIRLRELNQNINTAMLLVEYFHSILDKKNLKSFRGGLKLWYGLVKKSNLKPLNDFAKLVRKYRLNIETYIRTRLTTAVSEGLNNKIKVLKRMGYGYTNEKSFMNKILQRCGFLNSTHINTDSWFWGIPKELA